MTEPNRLEGDIVWSIRTTPITPQSDKGKELQDYLRRELQIPEHVKWFEVRFAMDEVVSVTCQYLPRTPKK